MKLHHQLTAGAVLLLSMSQQAAAELPVAGRVLAPDGAVPRGVTVSLEPFPEAYRRVELRLAGELGPPPVAETTPDDDGYFELAAPRLGAWRVVAGAPGRLTMEFLFRPLLEAEKLPLLELPPASPFEVRVVDAEGRPRAAAVAISSPRDASGWRARVRLGRAGDDGVVALPRGRDEEVRLEVLAPGYPLLATYLVPGTAGFMARLATGAARTVQVRDQGRQPLANVLIFHDSETLPLGRTDAAGRLRLTIDATAPTRVFFRGPGAHFGTAELAVPAHGRDTGDALTEVTLQPPRILRGRVLDRESRDPVPGALVWPPLGDVTETDRRGDYRLVVPQLRRITVSATAAGYGMSEALYTEEDAASLTGPTLTLVPAAAVSGRVVDGEGRPVAAVRIEVFVTGEGYSPRPRPGSWWSTTSSRHGRFQLSHLEARASHLFLFRKEGFVTTRRRVAAVAPPAARPTLTVVLATGRAGVGLVVDDDEVPVAGAEVRLVDPPPTQVSFVRGLAEAEERPAVATDEAGRFRIPDLGSGRYDLKVEAAGFAPLSVPGLRVADGTGEIDFGTVVLTAGVTITGQVRDPQGTPIPGAEIRTQDAARPVFGSPEGPEASTDEAGGFVLSGLRPGQSLHVVVSKPGYADATVRVEAAAGEPPLAIALDPAARVSGRVLDPNGDGIAGASVSAYSPGRDTGTGRDRPAPTDAEGRFLLDVSPGEVQLWVRAASYQSYRMSGLEVAAGEEVGGLEIVLRPGAAVTGRLTAADGSPVPRALVSVSRSDEGSGGGSSRAARTEEDGSYRVEELAPGPARIAARQGAHRQVTRTLELRPGTQRVDLAFEAGFEVSGRVTGPDGALAGASLRLVRTEFDVRHIASDRTFAITSAADGTFLFSDVTAGAYTLVAVKEGFAEASSEEPIEVAGAVRSLVLELRRGATLRGQILGLELDDLGQVAVHASELNDRRGLLSTREGQVDFEGQYAVTGLAPGRWFVRAQTSGRTATGQVPVTPGDSEVHLDLEFKTGFTLRAAVTSLGEPLRGARVFLVGSGISNRTTTDSEGRFRFDHLPSGTYRVLIDQGSLSHSERLEILSDEEVRFEIAAARVSGHVRDKLDQRPIAGAVLEIRQLDTRNPRFPWGRRAATSDSRGYFRADVQEGTWRLRAVRPGYAPAEATVEVRSGIVGEEIVFELEAAAGVSFAVVLASGSSPRQVQAAVLAADGRLLVSGTYEAVDGTFRISTVPAGAWELVLEAEESGAVRVPFTAPGHLGSIQLPAGGTLRLDVPDLQERGREPAWLTLVAPDGKAFPIFSPGGVAARGWPMYNGRASLSNLAAGLWRFTVTHPDGRTWTGSATVTPGAVTPVSLP